MLADWCQRLNCAFEAVKKVRLSIFDDFEALVILVATSLACFHTLDAYWVLIKVDQQKRSAELCSELKCNCHASCSERAVAVSLTRRVRKRLPPMDLTQKTPPVRFLVPGQCLGCATNSSFDIFSDLRRVFFGQNNNTVRQYREPIRSGHAPTDAFWRTTIGRPNSRSPRHGSQATSLILGRS